MSLVNVLPAGSFCGTDGPGNPRMRVLQVLSGQNHDPLPQSSDSQYRVSNLSAAWGIENLC
jgi:hypothetical protein